MSFIRNQAVTGFTFGLVNKSTGAALTGVASAIGKYVTKDGGTQASISGSIAEEGNGQYSVNLTAAEMNAAVVGLLFTHTDAIPVQFTIKTLGSPADTSTESSLSLSYADIRKEIGWFLFGERTSSNWTSDEGSQIDDIVKSGPKPPNKGEPQNVYKEKLRLYNDKIKAGEAWLEWAENNRDKIFN